MWVFGEEEFYELQKNQSFYLVEYSTSMAFKVFGHFAKPEEGKEIYSEKFPEEVDNSFETNVNEINSVLNSNQKYKFISELKNNRIFRLQEFNRISFLVRDIYYRGTFHYPCTFWHYPNSYIMTHPGNHLLFSLLMLGFPLKCFLTLPKKTENMFFGISDTKIIKKINTIKKLEEITGPEYLAWLQDDYIYIPAVTIKDNDLMWQKIDYSGFLRWPNIDRFHEWIECQWWWNKLDNILENPQQYLEVKTKFKNREILLGNIVGFLLNSERLTEDKNFKVINTNYSKIDVNNFIFDDHNRTNEKEMDYFKNRFKKAKT